MKVTTIIATTITAATLVSGASIPRAPTWDKSGPAYAPAPICDKCPVPKACPTQNATVLESCQRDKTQLEAVTKTLEEDKLSLETEKKTLYQDILGLESDKLALVQDKKILMQEKEALKADFDKFKTTTSDFHSAFEIEFGKDICWAKFKLPQKPTYDVNGAQWCKWDVRQGLIDMKDTHVSIAT